MNTASPSAPSTSPPPAPRRWMATSQRPVVRFRTVVRP